MLRLLSVTAWLWSLRRRRRWRWRRGKRRRRRWTGSGQRAGPWGKSFDISGTSDTASEIVVILRVLQHDIGVIKT